MATESIYWGYAPAIVDNELFCVVGDPLVSAVSVRQRRGAARTLGIAEKWKSDPTSVEPEHPAALIRAQAPRTVQVITDAWGAVPLFYGLFCGDLYIATSPDLIALCVSTEVDDLSVREFLATTQLSLPNTLFKGIWQVAPASSITLTPDGIISSKRYWTPPLPVEGKSVPAWAERLRDSVTETFRRIRAELGEKGIATLSAGLDTRYLVAIATRSHLLNVEAITISPIRNQEFWLAKRAAHLLGVSHKCVAPPRGGYGARMLKNAPVIPSHTEREHAHFADQALGEITSPFLLGGYMADTVLHFAGPFYMARYGAIQAGAISNDAPRWMLTTFGTTLDRETIDAISWRWERSDTLLGINERHEPSLATAYPATRQGHVAHFQAARREYPIYEAFMTRTALALGFEIPIALKQRHPKHDFYAPHLADLLSGMMMPDASTLIKPHSAAVRPCALA